MKTKAIEKMAANEHARWARWYKWQRDNSTKERIERWNKLAETPYSELTEELKQKDRYEVMANYEIFRAELASLKDEFRLLEAENAMNESVASGYKQVAESLKAENERLKKEIAEAEERGWNLAAESVEVKAPSGRYSFFDPRHFLMTFAEAKAEQNKEQKI